MGRGARTAVIDTVSPPTAMKKKKLAYRGEELEITPADLVPHDEKGTAWESSPISFEPVFTTLAPDRDDRTFKADVSFRGLLLPGLEVPLIVPYDLGIWSVEPAVFVMDPHETVAEKILGWCANRLVKHYADLAYIALVSHPRVRKRAIQLDYAKAREVTAAKLEAVRKIQPEKYAKFASVDALIGELSKPPRLDMRQWTEIMYVRAQRDRFTPNLIASAVREILAEGLRQAAPQ